MYNFGLGNFDVVSGGSSGSGISKQEVEELINKNNTEVVQPQIQSAVSQSATDLQNQIDTAVSQSAADMQSQLDSAISQTTSDMQAHVQSAIEQSNTEMQEHVQNVVTDAASDYDDTKIYDTYDALIAAEPEGREDVLYIITNEDNTRYIWNGTAYTAIEGRIGKDQITELFNSL